MRTAGGTTTHFVGDGYEVNPTTGVATAYYPFDGQAIAMKAGTTLSYLHRDHLGSLVSASDAGGGELGWARYLPEGLSRGATLRSRRCPADAAIAPNIRNQRWAGAGVPAVRPDYDQKLKPLLTQARDGLLAPLLPEARWLGEVPTEMPAGMRQADLV